MILFLECVLSCVLFGACIVGSAVFNKTFWLAEYDPQVQEKYLSLHPDFKLAEKNKNSMSLIIKKTVGCLILIALLVVMVYFAGAKDFLSGLIYSYIIWFVVNWFDVFVLDIGILAHWKKVRLPGTETMDKEYKANNPKSIKDGFRGMIIGLVAAAVTGGIIALIFR